MACLLVTNPKSFKIKTENKCYLKSSEMKWKIYIHIKLYFININKQFCVADWNYHVEAIRMFLILKITDICTNIFCRLNHFTWFMVIYNSTPSFETELLFEVKNKSGLNIFLDGYIWNTRLQIINKRFTQ